jgi:hypothetical protein
LPLDPDSLLSTAVAVIYTCVADHFIIIIMFDSCFSSGMNRSTNTISKVLGSSRALAVTGLVSRRKFRSEQLPRRKVSSATMKRQRTQKRALIVAPFLISMIMLQGEAKVPQHRVKRGVRQVEYKDLNNQFSKFWIPSSDRDSPYSRMLSSGSPVGQSSGEESFASSWFDENDSSWHIHVDANEVWTRANARRLSDSFVGFENEEPEKVEDDPLQGSITYEVHNQTWNVSTEFEKGGNETNSTSSVYSTSTTDGNETVTAFQPLRIRAVLTEETAVSAYLNDTEREILFHDILSPAIVAWSAALRVNPVVGNLTVDASQLPDGKSCGPGLESGHPSVLVPPEHMTDGIENTDFVAYLSISYKVPSYEEFVKNNTSGGRGSRDNGKKTRRLAAFQNSPPKPEGTQDLYCSGDYIAAATYCSTDQNDRPTAALLHLCVEADFFAEKSLKKNIMTVMHELGHALGFNPQSMAHFRDPDGAPITERDDEGNVKEHEIVCTGPLSNRRFANVTLPSDRIIQFRTVRGGVRVAEVVTSSVRQVARNHFDCQSLDGAELESGDLAYGEEESTSSCIGDHWERRLFRIDLMNAIVDEATFSLRISPITLALFADSGWYQVDLSRISYAAGWGRGAGCSFVEEECISPDGLVLESNTPFFCNQAVDVLRQGSIDEIQGCSPDMSRKAVCSMAQYDSELPPEYQYFVATFGSNVGGGEPLIDYCPVYKGFSNGLCKDLNGRYILSVSRTEEFGLPNSRCVSGRKLGQKTGMCLPIACVIEDHSLRVRVEGIWRECRYAGQVFKLKNDGENSDIICPDPIRSCPTFYCDRDCLGTNGVCDYRSGQCNCLTLQNNTILFGECGEVVRDPAEYVDPLLALKNSTQDSLDKLKEDSPLSDIYVPNEAVLLNEKRRPRIGLYAAICVILVTFLAGIGYLGHRRKGDCLPAERSQRRRISLFFFRSGDSSDDDDPFQPSPRDLSFRANKDKFVASLLVDLRVHNPQLEQQSVNDTMAETDSAANSSRQHMGGDELASDSGISDASSLSPDRTQQELELEEIPASQVIRRRVKFELV